MLALLGTVSLLFSCAGSEDTGPTRDRQSDATQTNAGPSAAGTPLTRADGRINWQAGASIDGPVTTSSDAFTSLEGMELHVERKGPVTVVVSLDIEGAGEVRLRRDNSVTVDPAPVSIDSARGGAMSFTFVDSGTRRFSCDGYKVEWRSPSGEELTLRKGSISAYFLFDINNKDGLECA